MNIRALTGLIICLILTSCGWQLRGHKSSATNIDAISVGGSGPYGAMGRALEKVMRQQNIKNTGNAAWHLTIISEAAKTTAVAFSDSNNPASNEVELKVRFTVTNAKGETIIAPNTERTYRIYAVNDNRRLAMDRESELLTRELYEEMAVNLLRRIDFIAGQESARQGKQAMPPKATTTGY